MLLQKEELEQKHLHLLQIVESEKTAKWQYTQQCEELTSEIKKLRAEVRLIFFQKIKFFIYKVLPIYCTRSFRERKKKSQRIYVQRNEMKKYINIKTRNEKRF